MPIRSNGNPMAAKTTVDSNSEGSSCVQRAQRGDLAHEHHDADADLENVMSSAWSLRRGAKYRKSASSASVSTGIACAAVEKVGSSLMVRA